MKSPSLLFLALAVSFVGLWACGAGVKPVVIAVPVESTRSCLSLFPDQGWRAVHKIEALWPGGGRKVLLGVTKAEPEASSLHGVLLTVEGLVLMEARRQGRNMEILRAVPPFDSAGFGPGLLDDVELMLLPPRGEIVASGLTAAGDRVCRWRRPGGEVQEICSMNEGNWRIRLFDPRGRLLREVEAWPPLERGFAARMRLKSFGPGGYELELHLLEAGP
ncbi:MAG: hypothetical protein AB1641_17195 [Thermodesulfobacteriota bacterium]